MPDQDLTHDVDDADIFRKEALDRRVRLEHLDASPALSTPRGWIALVAAVFFGIAAVLCLCLFMR
jgi:hypothetical protein